MKNTTFINAGAGSGKTYRLTTDLARKLTQENINPSQVILTTYTELAATEFREKARNEILAAKDKTGKLVNADVRIRCATELDNAFIGTVHAISYRFIRKYWYLLDYGADIQTMSDQNQDFYMSQSISDIVDDDDRKVFREFRESFDIKEPGGNRPYHLFWLPELKEIVDKMEYYDIRDTKESITKSLETAQKIFTGMSFSSVLSTLNAYLPALRSRCASMTSAKAAKCVEVIDEIYPLKSEHVLMRTDVRDALSDHYGNARDPFYLTGPYPGAMNAFNSFFVSKDFLQVIESYLNTIFNLAVRWRKALVVYKEKNHVISFDDMEKIFLSMLTEPRYQEVQQDIAANFRLLMVDEFQDSNPIQLKIFNRISELIAGNGGHSVWVGDPKQAIYAFRGSDSQFIAEILKKFQFSDDGSAVPEQGPDMLGTDQLLESWRSRPALVDFSNKVFLAPFLASNLKEKQIVLEPHFSAKMDTMGTEPALYVWRTEQDKNEARARMLAAKIQELVESGLKVHHKACDKETEPIRYRDIAVLCESNSACNTVAMALRKIGLPASCEERNLIQCLEVHLLKTILLLMQNPSDKLLRAELAMMLEDATTEEILKDRIQYVSELDGENDHWMDKDSGHPYADKIAQLNSFVKRYQRLSIYDTVVAIREELDLDNIVAKWGDATQRKHNLSSVVNLAKAYDDMCRQMGLGSSILGFIRYLTITKPQNKPDNAANTVKVLTYHRAKGLEWPVVILYQLWRKVDDNKELAEREFRGLNVLVDEDPETDVFNRGRHIVLFPFGIGGNGSLPALMQTSIENTLLFQALKRRAKEEALRVLYVGVTRAKDILVSFTSKKQNGGESISEWPKGLGIGNGESACPFGDGYEEILEELMESIYTNAAARVLTYNQTLNEPNLNEARPLNISPSKLESFPDSFNENIFAGESPERIIDMTMFAGEDSDAVKGTCIHNIFASFQYGDLEGNLQRITATLENFGFPNRLRAQKERIIESANWLHEFLTSAYGPATRIEKEYPLLYPLPTGQILRGEMDLLWFYQAEDGKEKCVLVDYKSFPGKRSELEAHTEQYYAQLSAYHKALTEAGIDVEDTLVYYPVQGHVRKLLKQAENE